MLLQTTHTLCHTNVLCASGGEFPGLYAKQDPNSDREVHCAPINNEAWKQNPRYYVANQRASRAGWTIWPVSALSTPQHTNHLEFANNLSFRKLRYIDCRHFCFPGDVLEARNLVLFEMLARGCV